MQKQRQAPCLQNGSPNIVKLSLVPKAVSNPMQYLYIHHQNANEFSTELENTMLRFMWRRKVSLNSQSNLREKDKTRGDMLLSSKYPEKLVTKTSSQQRRNTWRDKDSRMKHQEKNQHVYNWLIPDNSTKNIHLWKRLHFWQMGREKSYIHIMQCWNVISISPMIQKWPQWFHCLNVRCDTNKETLSTGDNNLEQTSEAQDIKPKQIGKCYNVKLCTKKNEDSEVRTHKRVFLKMQTIHWMKYWNTRYIKKFKIQS